MGMDTNDCDGHVGANEEDFERIRHNDGGELYHQVITGDQHSQKTTADSVNAASMAGADTVQGNYTVPRRKRPRY